MTRHIRKILFALIPLTFLLFQQSSKAALEGEACSSEPTDMMITYGSLITCNINPSGESDLFRFNGQAGESVNISVARESGDGTPCVSLLGPGGPLGNSCSISGNQFFPFKLPSTGTYTIIISEFLNDQTVNYRLALERVAPPSPPAMPIFYGDLLTDEINPTADLDLFQFPGQAGESVIVSAARVGGAGTPCVSLFDQAGTSLGGNVGQGFQCGISGNQFFPFKLPSTGTYTIVISEFLNDQTVNYRLALERVTPPSPPATSISFGQFLTDEINPFADLDLFYIYGTAASTIRISVARGSGNGTPCVSLFDQAGTSLGGNVGQGFQCSISGNQFPSFNLPSTGTYTIVISEFLNDQTVGYNLELQCLTVCPSPPSRADLSLVKTDCPDPAGADSTLAYKITVANSGPDPATSVTVTDILPPLTAFVSCSSTGGVCGGSGNNRTVTFNSLAVGASETITLIAVVNATAPDGIVLSNTAEVSSALFDPNLNNNAATATTTVGMTQMPGSLQFSAPSYSVNEGGGNATITTTRTGGSDGAVSVNYATANGTATAGIDYTAASGTLTFADGETSKTFTVPITNDSLDEPDETVNLTLSAPTGCATLGSPAAAVLTILDDDPPPALFVNDVMVMEGDGGTVNAVFTIGLSAASGQTVAVNFATANGTATAGSDYAAASGTLTFNPGDTGKTVAVQVNGDTTDEADETFFVNLSGATNATIADAQGIGTIVNDDTPTLHFSAPSHSVVEDAGSITINVSRSGDLSGAAAVDYITSDTSGVNNCNVISGVASSRCDYISSIGTLRFAAGETSKVIPILIVDDAYAEGSETFTLTLSNPTGASLGTPASTTVTITDNDTVTGPNPIDQASFFVRQHYLDFLNRQPDAAGLAFWSSEITSCGADAQCIDIKHINVSAAFFLSIEFQETGFLAYRMYKAAYSDTTSPNVAIPVPIIRLNEFLPDAQRISQGVQVGIGDWQTQLENNKNAYAREFVARPRFLTAYPLTMTPTQFVDKLNLTAGGVLSATERQQLIDELTAATDVTQGRASVTRKVAEDADLRQRENNRAFVLMQYYGYLRRNPDDPQDTDFRGWEFWLNKLNQFNGNFVQAEMVKAFILSIEYRQRFGP